MNVVNVNYKYRTNYDCFSKEDVIFEAFFACVLVKNYYFNYASVINVLTLVFAMSYHRIPSSEDGKLYMWGGGSEGQLGLGEKRETSTPTLLPFDEAIVCVACGYYHTAFVTGKIFVYQ